MAKKTTQPKKAPMDVKPNYPNKAGAIHYYNGKWIVSKELESESGEVYVRFQFDDDTQSDWIYVGEIPFFE